MTQSHSITCLKIQAQRFSAGYPFNRPRAREAGDRILAADRRLRTSAVGFTDFESLRVLIPALKRWATFTRPLSRATVTSILGKAALSWSLPLPVLTRTEDFYGLLRSQVKLGYYPPHYAQSFRSSNSAVHLLCSGLRTNYPDAGIGSWSQTWR